MAEDPEIPRDLRVIDAIETLAHEERCTMIEMSPYMSAFIWGKTLPRSVEQIACEENLMEKVIGNYVIVKKIISSLSWQNKLMCKHVSTMWKAAVDTVQREQLNPCDFVINLRLSYITNNVKLNTSDNFYTEPLAVFVFANSSGFTVTHKCEMLVPCPCEPPCENKHQLVDLVQHQLITPKDCGLTIKACYLSYMPLPQSITYRHIINRQIFGSSAAFISGIYIPVIPGVEFCIVNIKSIVDLKMSFYDVIAETAETRIVKGALVFVNESFLLHSVEDIVFLNYFTNVQPNVPYALGGCIVEDTLVNNSDMLLNIEGANEGVEYVTNNLISIGVFTVPKLGDNIQPDPGCQFEMYSLILESSDWAKGKIQNVINEFSRKIPHFENSVVIKLSCVGRDQKHEYEQECFRAAFPNTRLVGCYGNGELGVNHPPRPPPELYPNNKRHRRDPGPQYGIMYSYSTVFVYMGWGRIIILPET